MKKAIAYTVIGGIGLLALTGGVVVASEALEQRTDGGQILDGGAVTGDYTGGAVGRDLRPDRRGATPTPPPTPTPTPSETTGPSEQPAPTEPEHLPPAPPVEVDDDPDPDVDDDADDDVDDDTDDVDDD